MNINPIIESALAGIGCPVSAIKISDAGKPETYIPYYTTMENGELFGDDEEIGGATYATADIFSQRNFKVLVRDVKKALNAAGFTVTSAGPEMWEKDTGYYHVPVEFYTEDIPEEG